MNLAQIYCGTPCTPEDILQSRTDRVRHQKELLQRGCTCLISFTLNIPGAVKQFPLACQAFHAGLQALRHELAPYITDLVLTEEATGSEALLCLSIPPKQVKQHTVKLEECHPLGRLFDIDVLDSEGISLSRTTLGLPPRKCLLCSQEAKICARSRAHTLEALQIHVGQLLEQYVRDQAADCCASAAAKALLYEVSTTPKPGLVDRSNSGAHSDMDFFTFLNSSATLVPWFRRFFCIGWNSVDLPVPTLFQQLRFTGCQAEEAMYVSTDGVNTHKGLIFSMGLLCGALGVIQREHETPLPMDRVLSLCRELGQCALEDFAEEAPSDTNGILCFRSYQITGVRGQAAHGFPDVIEIGLPTLQHWVAQGLSLNDAGAMALIALLAQTTDTNMFHRGGYDLAMKSQAQAKEILENLNVHNFQTQISALDQEYIQKKLSPGGCADLLALSFMLFFLKAADIIQ